MPKDEKTPEKNTILPPPPPVPAVTPEMMAMIAALMPVVASLVAAEVAKSGAPKSNDEAAADHLRRARGQDRPLPPNESTPCVSPITRATFDAQLQRDSDGKMTVVQIVNYARPDGWDVLRKDGGLCTNEGMLQKRNPEDPGSGYTKKAMWEQHKSFYMRDWSEIGTTAEGRRELPEHWRAKRSADAAAE